MALLVAVDGLLAGSPTLVHIEISGLQLGLGAMFLHEWVPVLLYHAPKCVLAVSFMLLH